MPSSITLTVSHLPTSTSFFLSALQPLRYAYRGRAEQTVGFGPVNSRAPADFWITQEVPGVPVGAAHVAFPAPSREAVQDFFHAALKAGATIHGEPCVRDAHGYYSAAVIDFDGNSIEAVHRPGFGEENKENYAGTVVSKRSSSRAPSTVSRAPTSASRARSTAPTSVSRALTVAPSAAPESAPPAEPPKVQGDALETLLNQARSTADVARRLVEQVRPHLPTSSSAPPANKAPSAGTIHNPDAFAKPGDGGNAVIGTLLGVAAGAALTYAFSNSRKGSPDGSDDSRGRHARRPSIAGRSNTAPSAYPHHQHQHQSPVYRAIEAPPSHYISMQDHDYASTVKGGAARRRGSVDSGLGMSPPSTTGKSSSKKSMKMLEAPPTSYKAPTVITQAQSAATGHSRSSRSRTRDFADAAPPASRAPSKPRTQRSRSESRSGRSHVRHDSGFSTADSEYETVLHVTTQRAYGPAREDANGGSRSPPSAKWAANKQVPLPYESGASSKAKSKAAGGGASTVSKSKNASSDERPKRSSSRSAASTARPPEQYALPPSRAATWAAGGPGSSSNSKAESFVSARSGRAGGEGVGAGGDGGAKTVIGKMRDVARLRVKAGDVRPEDSVSQISSVRSARR